MALRLLPLVALTLALAFAGCTGDDAAPADGPGADASAGTDAGATAGGQAAQAVAATRTVESTPLHVEGRTSTGACAYVFTPVGAEGTCQYELGEDSFLPLTGGAPSRLAGVLQWTATAPNSEELNVYVLHERPEGGYWFDEDSPLATGPSPLSFDFDLSAYNETRVAVGVSNTQGAGLVAGYAAVSTSQDFVLDAVFETVVLREA